MNTHKNVLLVKGHLLLVLWILTSIHMKLEQKPCNMTDVEWFPSYSNYFAVFILIREENSWGQKTMEIIFHFILDYELWN